MPLWQHDLILDRTILPLSNFFFCTAPAPPQISTLSLHDALPICVSELVRKRDEVDVHRVQNQLDRHEDDDDVARSEEHTSELQSRFDIVCRPLLEKKKRGGWRCQGSGWSRCP